MSRPSTPQRRSHRNSGVYNILSQSPKIHYPVDAENLPLEAPQNTERFAKLSDSMEQLESNMESLQAIQESIASGFNESFAGFLYGLLMTMWCVDFPGKPLKDQWEKVKLMEDIDSRIDEAKKKLAVSQQENENLRKRLSGEVKRRRINFEDDTADSFVNDPPPQAIKRYSRSRSMIGSGAVRAKRSSSHIPIRDRESSSKEDGPNLNQAPRYMHGLFDSTNTRIPTATRRKHHSLMDKRPPFR